MMLDVIGRRQQFIADAEREHLAHLATRSGRIPAAQSTTRRRLVDGLPAALIALFAPFVESVCRFRE
jgi:hypothetical protein